MPDDPFIAEMRLRFDTTVVTVVSNPNTDYESRFEIEALIQGLTGSFAVDTPVFAGDCVVVPAPRFGEGGTERRYVATAVVLRTGPKRSEHHLKVQWSAAPAPLPARPARGMTFESLHPEVQNAAGHLFADGHFASSVSEGFKSIELRVQHLMGSSQSGETLMGDAFQTDGSVLDVASHNGPSSGDEREGFLLIFRGLMISIRSAQPNELFQLCNPQQALEYLGFASLLHRRIDAAEARW